MGAHEEYGANNNCPYHRTSLDNPFAHIHVNVSSPLVGYVPDIDPLTGAVTMVPNGTFTMDDVKAYWDHFFNNGADGRGNMANISTYGGENLTQNCWGASLGYNTWVQDPGPIYRDDYTLLVDQNWPSSTGADVIRVRNGKDTHVVSIWVVDYRRDCNLVQGTAEKFRHSGIYYIIYGWNLCLLKDYWRKN